MAAELYNREIKIVMYLYQFAFFLTKYTSIVNSVHPFTEENLKYVLLMIFSFNNFQNVICLCRLIISYLLF